MLTVGVVVVTGGATGAFVGGGTGAEGGGIAARSLRSLVVGVAVESVGGPLAADLLREPNAVSARTTTPMVATAATSARSQPAADFFFGVKGAGPPTATPIGSDPGPGSLPLIAISPGVFR